MFDYNYAKGAVDLSDQTAAYSIPLRKPVKWYKKLAINLLLNTAVVNTLILYQTVTGKKMQITEFRIEFLKILCACDNNSIATTLLRTRRVTHKFGKKPGPVRESR